VQIPIGSVRGKASREVLTHKTSHQRLLPGTSHTANAGEPYPRLPAVHSSSSSVPNGPRTTKVNSHEPRRIAPYNEHVPPSPERSMFQQAWHLVITTDPLVDSDEEQPDEHVRLDYTRRLQTLRRLRRKSPTPEPDHTERVAMDVDNRSW